MLPTTHLSAALGTSHKPVYTHHTIMHIINKPDNYYEHTCNYTTKFENNITLHNNLHVLVIY